MSSQSSQSRTRRRTARWLADPRTLLLASIAVTGLLYALPRSDLFAWPFVLLSTVAHEMGHGLAALLVGGSFHRLEMWSDGSGVAHWSGSLGRFRQATVAAGGLIGPAVAAAVGFAFGRRQRHAQLLLRIVVGLLLLAELLVVRGLFGMTFIALLTLALGYVAFRGSARAAQLTVIFLAVQLALSVFSRGDYLFTAFAATGRGRMPSDVGQMAEALILPFWFWGALCGALSASVLAFGLKAYWQKSG